MAKRKAKGSSKSSTMLASPPGQYTSFIALPSTVLREIAHHLKGPPMVLHLGQPDMSDLSHFTRTCKAVRDSTNSILWENTCMRLMTPSATGVDNWRTLRDGSDSFKYIKVLILRPTKYEHIPASDKRWKMLANGCPGLEQLEFQGTCLDLTRAESMALDYNTLPKSRSIVFPNLHSFRLTVFRQQCKVCKPFLFGKEGVQRSRRSSMVKHEPFPNLQKLDLVATQKDLMMIFRHTRPFSTVKQARIRTLGACSPASFEMAAIYFPNAESLTVGGSGPADFGAFICECSGGRQGRGVCQGITNIIHWNGLRLMPTLRQLTIYLPAVDLKSVTAWGSFTADCFKRMDAIADPPTTMLQDNGSDTRISSVTVTSATRSLAEDLKHLSKVSIVSSLCPAPPGMRGINGVCLPQMWDERPYGCRIMQMSLRRNKDGKIKVKGKSMVRKGPESACEAYPC